MIYCKECGSHAINRCLYGRDETDLDLCDVCYWRKRAEDAAASTRELEVQLRTSILSEGDVLHAATEQICELEQWKQAVIDGLVAAEIYRDAHESDPKAALKDLIQWRGLFKEGLNAMIMVRVLESKISAHEKVCAGVWVDVKERLPSGEPAFYWCLIAHENGEMQKGEVWFNGELWNVWGCVVTHWLDAKEP